MTHPTPLIIHPNDHPRRLRVFLLRLLIRIPLIRPRDRLTTRRALRLVALLLLLKLLHALLTRVALRVQPVALHGMVVGRPAFPAGTAVLLALLGRGGGGEVALVVEGDGEGAGGRCCGGGCG
jgi:hypothetical protein